jgi:hypothetical protein
MGNEVLIAIVEIYAVVTPIAVANDGPKANEGPLD